jgi:hypothetical protein
VNWSLENAGKKSARWKLKTVQSLDTRLETTG